MNGLRPDVAAMREETSDDPDDTARPIFLAAHARRADPRRTDRDARHRLLPDLLSVPEPDALVDDPGRHPVSAAAQAEAQARQGRAYRDRDRGAGDRHPAGADLSDGSLHR